ncbi:MAG: hypothetical protein Q9220_003821 [cf. Caloplaca sp. 1 TL-2023]
MSDEASSQKNGLKKDVNEVGMAVVIEKPQLGAASKPDAELQNGKSAIASDAGINNGELEEELDATTNVSQGPVSPHQPLLTSSQGKDDKNGKAGKVNKTSPKKRAAAAGDTDLDASPKKKKAPAKAKAATEKPAAKSVSPKKGATARGKQAPVKKEGSADHTSDGNQTSTTTNDGRSTPEPTTKEPRVPVTPKTPKAADANKSKDKTTPKTKAATTPKGKRNVSGQVADKVLLPQTWSAASFADKELVRMKQAGKSWNEIRAKWLEMTGQDTASSTLPNR